jgi:exoribonuclease R
MHDITKIQIHNRMYSSWSSIPEIQFPSTFHPAHEYIFHGDDVRVSKDNVQIIHSPTRKAPFLSGVLVLEGNKTYGRTSNKKRFYYRIIPEQTTLPSFLVPYEVKSSFSKAYMNKYVLFKFDEWNSKHPKGILHEILGNVDNLEAFYEYQLYSKNLNSSLKQFTKDTRECSKNKTTDEHIEDIKSNPIYQIHQDESLSSSSSSSSCIFSIDPHNSIDYDDAMSIYEDSNHRNTVTIYLANVFVWLEYFDLWNSFSNRVATVYLPDRRIPMLPSILSDNLCSLHQEKPRFAFAVVFQYNSNGVLESTSFQNRIIRVRKNYIYEEPELLHNADYQQLLGFTQRQTQERMTSHEIVSYWMIAVNKVCGEYLFQRKHGIFRTVKTNIEMIVPPTMTTEHDIQQFIGCTGHYKTYSIEEGGQTNHCVMKTNCYVQITSPIRRIVDLLNQMMILKEMGIKVSQKADIFICHWIGKLDEVNTLIKSIRKIQTNCALLNQCKNCPEILDQVHCGIVFDKHEKPNGVNTYMVYLKRLKLLSRMKTANVLENNSSHEFRICFFEKEHHTKKKIQLFLV